MQEERTKVLYIAGWGRSGSTVLGNILDQVEGFFHVGELRYLWDRNLVDNRSCGCGKPLRDCEVWQKVLEEAFGDVDQVDAVEMTRLRESSVRTRHLPLMLLPHGEGRLRSRRLEEAHLDNYMSNLEKLYRAVRSSTGCRVIVDSSKFPSYGYVLETMPSIDLYVLHLVRDPRAVAYSWQRKKLEPDRNGAAVYMKQHGPVQSSLLWESWNVATELFWKRFPERYLMLRYEDFVSRPQEALESILDLVQERPSELPFVGDRELKVGENHTVSGNPNRFQKGTVKLRPDEEWRTKIKRRDKAMVTTLTWLLLVRYGYLGKNQ